MTMICIICGKETITSWERDYWVCNGCQGPVISHPILHDPILLEMCEEESVKDGEKV